MGKFSAGSLAFRLFVLAALPSTLPILADLYFDRANRPVLEDMSPAMRVRPTGAASGPAVVETPATAVTQADFANDQGTPRATAAEARPRVLAVNAPVLPASPGGAPASSAEASLSSTLPHVVNTTPVGTIQLWKMHGTMVVAGAYVAGLALSMLGVWSVLRSLHRFGDAAEQVARGRPGGNALASRNGLPELAGVAAIVDGLVSDLRTMSDQMRISVEENTHSLRTPLATIQGSFRAVSRALPADEPGGQRALRIMDAALRQMSSMVDAMERDDRAIAKYLSMPRECVDISRLVGEVIREFRQSAESRDIKVREDLQDGGRAWTCGAALASALRDVLASAVNASAAFGEVGVTLDGGGTGGTRIVVEDRGGDEDIDLLFQHGFSPSGGGAPRASVGAASGRTGLWHVKRMLEALGGQVAAHRNLHGGVSVSIALPAMRP